MEYKLVVKPFHNSLEEEVNNLLKEGWKCQGGVSVTTTHHFSIFAQAMTKEVTK